MDSGRDVFMSNVEMVSFTFCVTNRKIGYKILRAWGCVSSPIPNPGSWISSLECSVSSLVVLRGLHTDTNTIEGAGTGANLSCKWSPVFGHGTNFDAWLAVAAEVEVARAKAEAESPKMVKTKGDDGILLAAINHLCKLLWLFVWK